MVILYLERFHFELLKNIILAIKIKGEDPMQNYFNAIKDKKERIILSFVFCPGSTSP